MESLKPVVSKYVSISKELQELNARAVKLREARNYIELDLAAEYASSKETLPEKIELTASQMVFSVKKPGEWKKGWTLSKKQLEEYLLEILPEHGPDVMREIILRHEPKLVGHDYSFELRPTSVE
jgi:hypothetical protein